MSSKVLPEYSFPLCSAALPYPCNSSHPLNLRTCPGLRTAKIGPTATWPPARFCSPTGCPRNARSRDSCNGLTAKPQSASGNDIVGLKYFLTLSRLRIRIENRKILVKSVLPFLNKSSLLSFKSFKNGSFLSLR